jgi:amino-acid N-acetyltransferase
MRPHPATLADLPGIKKLLNACALESDGLDRQIDRYLVVRDMSGVIGCACAEQYGAVGVLKVIAVSERARSSGLGELLLGALVADVRQRGVQSLVLRTERATGFFSRLGFTPISPADVPPPLLGFREFTGDRSAKGTVMQAVL